MDQTFSFHSITGIHKLIARFDLYENKSQIYGCSKKNKMINCFTFLGFRVSKLQN